MFVRFAADSRTAITIYSDDDFFNQRARGIRFWNVETCELQRTIINPPFEVSRYLRGGDWTPDELRIIAYAKKSPHLYDALTGREIAKLPYGNCVADDLFGTGGCAPFRFGLNGRVAVKDTDKVKVFDTNDGSLIAELTEARAPVRFGNVGNLLATKAKDNKRVLLWQVVAR